MLHTDLATRAYNHGFRLDPIVRSLLDTDFYKLLMLQMIWRRHPGVHATFELINRNRAVRLADTIPESELRAQLDYARGLRFSKRELIWLAGNTFYGRQQMFAPDFLAWLADVQLPEYELSRRDGQYELRFPGPWMLTTLWEIPALAIVNELRVRAAPYRVLEDWRELYSGNLLIVLPDAFGTAAFLRDAPDWVADWTGFRPDSLPPVEAGEQIMRWWRDRGRDPARKLLIFSDGMDVDSIERTYRHFHGRVRMSFGWGTNLTNDFRDCAPFATDGLDSISLVCKVVEADGRPAVKLSDNPSKATGDGAEIARYLRVFGGEGRSEVPVVV